MSSQEPSRGCHLRRPRGDVANRQASTVSGAQCAPGDSMQVPLPQKVCFAVAVSHWIRFNEGSEGGEGRGSGRGEKRERGKGGYASL